jgi:hypothetical protein
MTSSIVESTDTHITNAIYAKTKQYQDEIIRQQAENKLLRQQVEDTNKLLDVITQKMSTNQPITEKDIPNVGTPNEMNMIQLQIYNRMMYELNVLNTNLQNIVEDTKNNLFEMNNMLTNSQKYYYVICQSLI